MGLLNNYDDTTGFIHDFNKIVQERSETEGPAWLKQLRTQSLEQFKKVGIPTTKDEEWKYTNLSPLTETSFTLEQAKELKEKEAFDTL